MEVLVKLAKEDIIKIILDNEIEDSDEEVIDLILGEQVAKNINKSHKDSLTIGDVIADKLASFAGSWRFIIIFASILFFWILGNSLFAVKAFDPFPFILMNLVLSALAALQAPVIMMSQNRQEEKDRIRANNDYKVNLKVELIIEDLHRKIDQTLTNQERIITRLNLLETNSEDFDE